MNLLGCLGSSVIIARLVGDMNHFYSKEEDHDSGVCDERALLIVLLRALTA